MKLRNVVELACNEATHVDDIHVAGRVVGETNHTRLACKQLKSNMNCLGNQADDCKYRDVSATPSPSNGGIIHTYPLSHEIHHGEQVGQVPSQIAVHTERGKGECGN